MNTEENTLQCDLCQKDFTCFSKLTRHKRTYTGEKPLQCSICQKTFKQCGHLTIHKLSHTVERPFNAPSVKRHSKHLIN